MKKLLGIIVLSLLCTNFVYAENVYDFLKNDTEYSRGSNTHTIYAHNSHSSKTILVTKFEVMFTDCALVSDGAWNNPDRVYAINQKVFPQSDKEININARYPSSAKKRCTRLWGQFVSSNNTNNENLGSAQFLGTECINGRKYNVFKSSITNKKSYLLTADQSGECEEKFKSKRKAGDPVYERGDPIALFKFFRNPISWIIIPIILGIIIFVNKFNKSKVPVRKQRVIRKTVGENFIEKVWNGNETMSKTFWMYCVLFVGVISFISGLFLIQFGVAAFAIPAIVIIWSNTGLWRSSTIYKNLKIKSRKGYGWAIAAKIYVVFNYIVTLSQIGLMLNV